MDTAPTFQTHRVRRRRHRGIRHRLVKLLKSPNVLKIALVVIANAMVIATIVALASLIK